MVITKDELLRAPADEYMNDEQLAFFRQLLEDLRRETMDNIEAAKQQLASPPKMNDEADRASYEEESLVTLRIVDRERRLLPKIDAAKKRIASGDYGYCLETGEPIGILRLLARSTAELCAEAKTLNERREFNYRR